MDKSFKDIKFSIVHHRGTPNDAILVDGTKVYRKDYIWFPEAGHERFVRCSPDDVHFIYENKELNYVTHQCTCGSMAVVVGHKNWAEFGSPIEHDTGEMFICYSFAQFGKHLDGTGKH